MSTSIFVQARKEAALTHLWFQISPQEFGKRLTPLEWDLDYQKQHYPGILVNESVQVLLIIMRYCSVEIHFSHEVPLSISLHSFFECATLANNTVRCVLMEVSV